MPPHEVYLRNRDGVLCVYCKKRTAQVVEHVIPRSKGGRSGRENLVMACNSCNMRKAKAKHLDAMITHAWDYLTAIEPAARHLPRAFAVEEPSPEPVYAPELRLAETFVRYGELKKRELEEVGYDAFSHDNPGDLQVADTLWNAIEHLCDSTQDFTDADHDACALMSVRATEAVDKHYRLYKAVMRALHGAAMSSTKPSR